MVLYNGMNAGDINSTCYDSITSTILIKIVRFHTLLQLTSPKKILILFLDEVNFNKRRGNMTIKKVVKLSKGLCKCKSSC